MATTHRRFPQDASGTRHLAGWWNWCLSSGPPATASVEENMTNATWRSWYTRQNYEGNDGFYVNIVYDGSQGYPCWNGLIYNYQFGYWEAKLYSCYPVGRNSNWTGNGTEGWTMWEGKGDIDKSCPNMAGTSAHYLQVRSTGSWKNINVVAPSLSSGILC